MIRRLSLPHPAPEQVPAQRPLRLLAVSDEVEPSLDFASNRSALQPLDAIVGAGDLEPEYLDFLAGAFCVPLLYVLGNHDRGGGWEEERDHVPAPMDGTPQLLGGLRVAGLSWPADRHGRAIRDEGAAWRQVAAAYLRLRRRPPDIIVSHVPPLGLGDTPEDHYHRGFAAYRWLLRAVKPDLWIHGHTAPAAASSWWQRDRTTTVVNVTGAVLIEVTRAASEDALSPGRTGEAAHAGGRRP